MKIVIISAFVFPVNSPRANRTTELAKEFGRRGFDVTIYALLGKYDYSEIEREFNIKVKNIGKQLFSRITSDNKYKKPDFFLIRAIRRTIGKYIEFPDIVLTAMTFYVLKKEKNIDLLISIATPYPIHWGVALFRSIYKKEGIKETWIADCGDPFMGNKFLSHPSYFKYVEKWFCRKADYLAVPFENAKDAYYPEYREKIKVIPQGFNFEKNNYEGNYNRNLIPTFIYAGIFYPGIRDPRPLLDYLIKLDLNFKFIIYTKKRNILEKYICKLKEKIDVREYIPREDLLIEMSKADFLLNLENNTTIQTPSKLIDYALVKRPILSINSNIPLNEEIINQFLNGDYSQSLKVENIEKYNIKNVANKFLSLLKHG